MRLRAWLPRTETSQNKLLQLLTAPFKPSWTDLRLQKPPVAGCWHHAPAACQHPPRAARSAQTRLSYPKPWLCAFQLEVAELWCVCSALNTATKASQGIIIIIWALGPRDTPSATQERDDQRVRCRERTTRLHAGHQHLTRFLCKTTETPQEGRKCTGHLSPLQ